MRLLAFDVIELLRDPSHKPALPLEELRVLGQQRGLAEIAVLSGATSVPLETVLVTSFSPPGTLDHVCVHALLRYARRAPLQRPLLHSRSCATKLPGSNPDWRKSRGHVTAYGFIRPCAPRLISISESALAALLEAVTKLSLRRIASVRWSRIQLVLEAPQSRHFGRSGLFPKG